MDPQKEMDTNILMTSNLLSLFSMVYAFDIMSKNSLPSPSPKEFFLCFL